jgi:hypothetical protein
MITSYHHVQHTPRTASCHDWLSPAPSQSLCRSCCTKFSTFPQLQVNQWIETQLPSRLPPELQPADCQPQSTLPISLDAGLQVHLPTYSITASKCISELTHLQPPSVHDHGLQVHIQTLSITTSKCISELARLWPASLHNHGLQMHLQTHLIMASKCISRLARSWPPSASPSFLDHSLQVGMITASKCISRLAQSEPPK